MSRQNAEFVVAETGPVPITADFLGHVHERLSGLADALDRQETSARRLVGGARDDIGLADRNWSGPRSRKVVTSASTYLDAVAPYADAICSAKHTIRKWSRAAAETAEQLARAERLVFAPAAVAWCGTPDPNVETRCGTPDPDAIEEIRASWRRHSRRIGAELDAATAAIAQANAAVAADVATDDVLELRSQLGLQNLLGADHVRRWWNRQTDAEQLALLTAYPGLLAGLDGLPPRIHTQARRTQAGRELVRLEALAADGELTPQQARRLREIRGELSALGVDDDQPEATLVAATRHEAEFVAFDGADLEFRPQSGR